MIKIMESGFSSIKCLFHLFPKKDVFLVPIFYWDVFVTMEFVYMRESVWSDFFNKLILYIKDCKLIEIY